MYGLVVINIEYACIVFIYEEKSEMKKNKRMELMGLKCGVVNHIKAFNHILWSCIVVYLLKEGNLNLR